MNRELYSDVAEIVHENFSVTRKSQYAFTFKSKRMVTTEYILNYEFLRLQEVRDVARILNKAYEEPEDFDFADPVVSRFLSLGTRGSASFVSTVLELEGSAIHKLFLLTSGAHIITDANSNLLIQLAKMKSEEISRFSDVSTHSQTIDTTSAFYIIPGVTSETIGPGMTRTVMTSKESTDLEIRIIALIARNDPRTTLRDILEMDLSEVLESPEDISSLHVFTEAFTAVVMHRELAESMTAKEICALGYVIGFESRYGLYPESLILRRAKAIAQHFEPGDYYDSGDIYSYLSKEERKRFYPDSLREKLIASLDDLSIHCRPIYAALAEVLVSKGEARLLEVLRELQGMTDTIDHQLELGEEAVKFVLEALKSDADDYPFSWYSQFSEHSWILSPDAFDDKPEDKGMDKILANRGSWYF